MATHGPGKGRRILLAIPLILLLIAALASLLPLIGTNIWFIRLLEFPRLQLALITVVLLVLYFVVRGRPGWMGIVVVLLSLIGLGYHAYKL